MSLIAQLSDEDFVNALRVDPSRFNVSCPKERASTTFNTESEASDFVRAWLRKRELPFSEQVWTGSGKIDFMIDAEPRIGIEVKRDINDQTNASVLADYFEQAAGYAKELECPVFLGPAISERRGQDLHLGGPNLAALCALVIFGGRANVGVLAFCHWGSVTMALRGAIGYRWTKYGETYRQEVFRMVTSTNSKKTRK